MQARLGQRNILDENNMNNQRYLDQLATVNAPNTNRNCRNFERELLELKLHLANERKKNCILICWCCFRNKLRQKLKTCMNFDLFHVPNRRFKTGAKNYVFIEKTQLPPQLAGIYEEKTVKEHKITKNTRKFPNERNYKVVLRSSMIFQRWFSALYHLVKFDFWCVWICAVRHLPVEEQNRW